MSDSDSDYLTNSYSHHKNTILKAAGPSVATSIRLGCNRFANSSRLKIPESKDYHGLNPQTRSLCNFRDSSSACTSRSVRDWPQRNFQFSLYNNSRKNFNGRCTSPESVRSIGSNVTVANITSALHSSKLNVDERTEIITTTLETFTLEPFNNLTEHNWRKIKKSYKNFMKNCQQKRRAKRINVRKFFKGGRDVSGGESGEQASNSSISSDDCTSTRTGVTVSQRNTSLFKKPKSRVSDDSISKIDTTSIRKPTTDKQSGLHPKFSSNIKQDIHPNNLENSPNNRNKFKTPAIPPLHRPSTLNGITKRHGNIASKNHYPPPSQRFNRTTVSNTILEEHENKQAVTNPPSKAKVSEPKSITGTDSSESESGNETQNKQVKKFNNLKRKTTNHEDDNKTRKKLKKQTPEKIKKNSPHRDKEKNDFVFARPGSPVSKYVDLRTEKMIAQSHPTVQADEPSQEPSLGNFHSDKVLNSTNDVSARPSSHKRTLFTLTMDLTEIKNISNDNYPDSPASKYYSDSIKDRRKARRLVSGQSCLMREVSNDNNQLDLMPKTVPIDQLQSFSQRSNVGRSNIDNNTTEDKYDKVPSFDVASILTNCNEGPASDTYTDEEIFTVTKTKSHDVDKNVEEVKNTDKNKKQKHQITQTTTKKSPVKVQPSNMIKRDISSYLKSFWDSDSDCEKNPSNNYCVGNKQDVRLRINRLEDEILKKTLQRDNERISIEDSEDYMSTPVNERTTIVANVKGPKPKRIRGEVCNEKNKPIPTKRTNNAVLSESVRRNNTRKRTPNKKYADVSGACGTLRNGTLKTETNEVLRVNTKSSTKAKNPNSGNPITRTKLILRSSIGTSDDSLLNSSRRSERLKRLLPNISQNLELKDRKASGKQSNKKQQTTVTKSNRTPIANKTRTVNNSTMKRVTPQRKKTHISSERSCKKQTVPSQNMKSNKDETECNVSSEKENNERHTQTRSNSMNRSVSENNKINMLLKPVKNNLTSNLIMKSMLRAHNTTKVLNNILNDSSPNVTGYITMKNNTIFNPCIGKQSENKTHTKTLDSKSRNTTKQKVEPHLPNGKLSQQPDPRPRTRKDNIKKENNPVLKLSKATVGMIPRHCGLDEVCKSGGFDDTFSFRSTSTVLTRSKIKKLKMLHLF